MLNHGKKIELYNRDYPEAEGYYIEILEYLYKYHSEESADRKSKQLLEKAIVLEMNP